jgi:hypothetical protein
MTMKVFGIQIGHETQESAEETKKYFEREFWCKNCEQTAIRKFPAGTTIIQACLAGDGTSYKILPGKPGHIELRCELCEVGALF